MKDGECEESGDLGAALAFIALSAPRRTMLHNPVQKRLFEPNIVTCLLTLNPLMPQDLFSLGEKLFVEKGFFHQIGTGIRWGAHGSQ